MSEFSIDDIIEHVLSTRYLACLLSIVVALPAFPLADVFYRGCEGLLGNRLLDVTVSGCISNEPNAMSGFRYFAGFLAVLLLFIPELGLQMIDLVPRFEHRQMWNRFRFRFHFSWIALYLAYVTGAMLADAVDETSSVPVTESEQNLTTDVTNYMWVSGFSETVQSPVGFLGLCASVSCISSGTWLVVCWFVYVVRPSELPRDPTHEGTHEFAWMIFYGITNYVRGEKMFSQVAHFVVVRVLTHYVTSHTFKSLKPLVRRPISRVHSSELSEMDFISDHRCILNRSTQLKAIIALFFLVALPAYVGVEVFALTSSPEQAIWAAFPAWTMFGKASRWLFKYCVFWNHTWFLYQGSWGDRFVCYPRRELAQIYGKLLDLIVVSITFIPIGMTFLKSEEDDLSAYAISFWMLLILIQRSKSYWQAARKHSKVEDAKTMAQGEPQIEDICQICASDIFSSDHDVINDWSVRTIQCGHVFHLNCIRDWVSECSCSCPVCGRVIKAPLRSQANT